MVRFSDIVGNGEVIKHFQTTLRTGNVSHAYLLSGADGSGKNMLADAFTTALLCEEGGTEPCGRCKSCMQAASGNHPDIFRITHEKTIISVNDIREQLNANVSIKPYSSRYKVFIVDEAELMNDEAQNALLKTLEEPPEYVVILLLSASEDALLPTILSRCIRLVTRPIPSKEISSYIVNHYSLPDYQADVAAAFSGGYLGEAIKFATDAEAEEERQKILGLLAHFDDLSISEIKSVADVPADRRDAELDLFLMWLRDVMYYKATKDEKRLILKNENRVIERAADLHSFEALERAVAAVSEARDALKSNVRAELVLETLVLKLRDREP